MRARSSPSGTVWLPQSDTRPVGQLTGGGPRVTQNTYIHGMVTRQKLTLKMSKLDGTVLQSITLTA